MTLSGKKNSCFMTKQCFVLNRDYDKSFCLFKIKYSALSVEVLLLERTVIVTEMLCNINYLKLTSYCFISTSFLKTVCIINCTTSLRIPVSALQNSLFQ